jgi:hypothetical protein
MKRFTMGVAALALASACASSGSNEWQRADGTPDSEAVSEQRAKDRATCATRMGAPTPGGQSTLSYSRDQVEDCMRARGWRRGSASGN